MDRNVNQHTINPHTGLIPADVAKKASELGLLPQLREYSKMNAQRRREVYQQVLSLAKALGTSTDNVKSSLQLDVIFDPDEARQQQSAAAERAYSPYGAYGAAYIRPAAAERAYSPYGAYGAAYIRPAAEAIPSSLVARMQEQKHTCRYYIARLKIATEELERVKEENARLEKENAALIELLPGRGGSRKHKAMHRITRRKRH